MPFVGKLVKSAVVLNDILSAKNKAESISQIKTLKALLDEAQRTAFGQAYSFGDIQKSPDLISAFQSNIPIFEYDSMYKMWWHRAVEGEQNVTWTGKLKYIALTSGTSEAASKKIPLTMDMLAAMRKAGFRQFCTLGDLKMPSSFYDKQMLMLGGSSHLSRINKLFEGDLSGILAGNLPPWINRNYRPGKLIAHERDWATRIEMITREARNWDIGIISGVPSWMQMLFESIFRYYNTDNIYDIWPNLKIFVHGGVSFDPYRSYFKKVLGEQAIYLETYLASEGFIGYERLPGKGSMSLVLNNGIFYEFIPFNSDNFDHEGNVKASAKAIPLWEVEVGAEYAIVLSTCAGAWRYLIGDTVKFVDLIYYDFVITGRTRHFISLCGEHVSLENMSKAINVTAEKLNMDIREFTVCGTKTEQAKGHHWYVGTNTKVSESLVRKEIDETLMRLNDDYRSVRTQRALSSIKVTLLPNSLFYDWMKSKGKLGGQHKFPRVLTNEKKEDWESFIKASTAPVN